jgi:Tol biopolymer transport system component
VTRRAITRFAMPSLLFVGLAGLLVTACSKKNNPTAPKTPAKIRQIALWSSRDGRSEIYVMNTDGTNQTRLTNVAGGNDLTSWTPDGSKNIDGSGQTNITNAAGADYEPAWSPDGIKIAFDRDGDGNSEIYVMNANGTGQLNLTNNAGNDTVPFWSPSGTKIAFATDRDGNSEVYVMNADGTGQTNLTNDPGSDSDPSWSP